MNRERATEHRRGITLLRIGVYAVTILILSVFQTTFAARFGFFGTTPALVLALVSASACFEGERTGAVVGLATGFCVDALGGVGISVLPAAYAAIGWFCGWLAVRLGQNREANTVGTRLLIWTILSAISVVIGCFVTVILLLLNAGSVSILSAFLHIVLPEAVGTYLFGYPIGVIFLLFDRHRRKTAEKKSII